MNIAITLPRYLIQRIISGEKTLEMRKSRPKANLFQVKEDGFFICEKGLNAVVCWCRIDEFIEIYPSPWTYLQYGKQIAISEQHFINYNSYSRKVFLWKIGKVIVYEKPLSNEDILIDRNPQSFVYTPLSHSESY